MGGCSICGKVLIGTSSSAVCYDCSGETYMYHPCAGCIEKDKRIAELEAEVQRLHDERVSDDLLERLIGEIGENPNVGLCEYEQEMLDEAEAIRIRRTRNEL